jgi:hypothetical protein
MIIFHHMRLLQQHRYRLVTSFRSGHTDELSLCGQHETDAWLITAGSDARIGRAATAVRTLAESAEAQPTTRPVTAKLLTLLSGKIPAQSDAQAQFFGLDNGA